MWVICALLETAIALAVVLVIYIGRQVLKRLDVIRRNETPYAKSHILFGVLFPSSFFFLAGILTWGFSYELDISTFHNLERGYTIVSPCIESSTNSTYIVSCNAAYQLSLANSSSGKDGGYSIQEYNADLEFLKENENNWFMKYENIKVPDYIKTIVVNSSCECK